MNKEPGLTLSEDQIKIERGNLPLNSPSAMRTSYLDVNNEGSDGTDGSDADGTDGADADGTDVSDADGTDVSDADGTDGTDTDTADKRI